jgi:hypothetical protein
MRARVKAASERRARSTSGGEACAGSAVTRCKAASSPWISSLAASSRGVQLSVVGGRLKADRLPAFAGGGFP